MQDDDPTSPPGEDPAAGNPPAEPPAELDPGADLAAMFAPQADASDDDGQEEAPPHPSVLSLVGEDFDPAQVESIEEQEARLAAEREDAEKKLAAIMRRINKHRPDARVSRKGGKGKHASRKPVRISAEDKAKIAALREQISEINARGTRPDQLAAADRARKAFELRLQGYSLAVIAETLGFASRAGAKYAIERILSNIPIEAGQMQMTLYVERMNTLLAPFFSQALTGDAFALDAVLKITDRLRDIHGITAPTKIAPTTPDGSKPYEPAAQAGLAALMARLNAARDTAGEVADEPEK